jgi:hypothetical protein
MLQVGATGIRKEGRKDGWMDGYTYVGRCVDMDR